MNIITSPLRQPEYGRTKYISIIKGQTKYLKVSSLYIIRFPQTNILKHEWSACKLCNILMQRLLTKFLLLLSWLELITKVQPSRWQGCVAYLTSLVQSKSHWFSLVMIEGLPLIQPLYWENIFFLLSTSH